jgi:hypothetical protein
MNQIVMAEDELMRDLLDYFPLKIEELPLGEWYPKVATLSPSCTVLVHEWASSKVH